MRALEKRNPINLCTKVCRNSINEVHESMSESENCLHESRSEFPLLIYTKLHRN